MMEYDPWACGFILLAIGWVSSVKMGLLRH